MSDGSGQRYVRSTATQLGVRACLRFMLKRMKRQMEIRTIALLMAAPLFAAKNETVER
jgi:hypothetical protein